MKLFFEDVELVKQNIFKIMQATEQIGEVNQAVLTLSPLFFSLCLCLFLFSFLRFI